MQTKKELMRVLAEIDDPRDMEQFCEEILTPRELEDLVLRWQLVKELHEGIPQRAIAARHRISLCKITRGSKVLKKDNSFVLKLVEKYRPQD